MYTSSLWVSVYGQYIKKPGMTSRYPLLTIITPFCVYNHEIKS